MKLTGKQKSFLAIFVCFGFGILCKELGEFIIKGQTEIETYSYFIVIGAAIASIVGITITKKNDSQF